MATSRDTPPPMDVGHYVERITGAEGAAIAPAELLAGPGRSGHLLDWYVRLRTGTILRRTGSEALARRWLILHRHRCARSSRALALVTGARAGRKADGQTSGPAPRRDVFRYKPTAGEAGDATARIAAMRAEGGRRLAQQRSATSLELRVLITGATGFIGKEVLHQMAGDRDVVEVVAVIRGGPGRRRGEGAQAAARRGVQLLDRLGIQVPAQRAKFRFVEGDIEAADLGIGPAERARLGGTITHTVHCAASVAFDDPYPWAYRINVLGTLNALRLSHALQSAEDSRFVAHIGIGTAYIHGRKVTGVAREGTLTFPRRLYNNYYELTKAMAAIESERFLSVEGLRLTELCPTIVIGESVAGNNRGDTKVVNAPVNLIGRASQAASDPGRCGLALLLAKLMRRVATLFPGDPTAALNLVTVDRVAAGIIAALKRPQAIGERIHLASDRPVAVGELATIFNEELGVEVTLMEPKLHRTVLLPGLARLLRMAGKRGLATLLTKQGSLFSGYTDWGQTRHEVGKDVAVLGLSESRPDPRAAFRMLCRHNRLVQHYGQLRDEDELSRRERAWMHFVQELEAESGTPAGCIPPETFRQLVERRLAMESTTMRRRSDGAPDSVCAAV